MRYPKGLIDTIIKEHDLGKGFETLARQYKVPVKLVNKWCQTSVDEIDTKERVRQLLCKSFPDYEAQIVIAFEDKDAIVCSITDEELEEIGITIQKILFNLALETYKRTVDYHNVIVVQKPRQPVKQHKTALTRKKEVSVEPKIIEVKEEKYTQLCFGF